jgi:phosphopantetheinyl transferase (holo-ACP synthase)
VILGIGTDLAGVRRIERTIARHGDGFLHRIFVAITDEFPLERAFVVISAVPAGSR